MDIPQELQGAGGLEGVGAVIFLTESHGPLGQGEGFLKFSRPGQVTGLLKGILRGRRFNLGPRCPSCGFLGGGISLAAQPAPRRGQHHNSCNYQKSLDQSDESAAHTSPLVL